MKDAITWLAAIRAVHFTACLLALGVCLFDQLVIARIDSPHRLTLQTHWQPIFRKLFWLAAVLSLLSGGAWLLFVVADMNDVPLSHVFVGQNFVRVWHMTHFGRLTEWRLVALLVAMFGFVTGERWPNLKMAGLYVTLAATAILAGSIAWTGHGQMGIDGGWHIWADVAHLLIVACWPIGLLPLVLLLRSLKRSADPTVPSVIAMLATRFSTLALLSVILLTGTGLLNTWSLLGSPTNLYKTPYGQVLSIKLILFAAMIAVGAVNLLKLKPRLQRINDVAATASRLRRNVWIELLLAGLLMLAVGALGRLSPPGCCGPL